MNTRETIIETARQLEALPPLAVELIELLRSDDADVAHVAEVIAHDPASSANVLKLANSAAMAPVAPINGIKQAVMRIGLRKTTELVLNGVVAEHINRPVLGYDLPPGALWEFSAAAAIATERLAAAHHKPAPPEAFTAGLLQDIGKLILGHFVQVDFEPIRTYAFEHHQSFEQAEQHVLGINHAEVGAILIEVWGIDGCIRDAVRWHHEPQHASDDARHTAQLVHAAGQIVNLAGIGGGTDGSHYRPSDTALDELDISPRIVEQVMRETVSQLEDLRGICTSTNESSRP